MSSFINNNVVAIVLAVLLLLITTGYILWLKKQKSRKNILLLGCSGSGKTALFLKLVHKASTQTYTSITVNSGFYSQNKQYIKIVDIPGNEKIRQKYFDQYKPDAMAIIFVIDSNTIQSDIRDVAEYLYTVLTDPCITRNCNMMILCNKQDGTLAKRSTPIKFLLEKELDLLRGLKSKTLEDQNHSSTLIAVLGYKKKPFEFSHCKSVRIEFGESVACAQSEDVVELSMVTHWLQKLK